MIGEWGWAEWLVAISVFGLLFDTHKRASRAMDATERIERRLNELRPQRTRDDYLGD